jgi:hypothetical protein
MKLAEALLLRADLQTNLASLRERIVRNAVVQQSEKPHEDPAKLLKEAHGLLDELESLVFRINRTNLRVKAPDGRSLAELLAQRDMLKQRHSLLMAATAGSHKEPDRYSMSEIKWKSVMNVASLQKQADDVAK